MTRVGSDRPMLDKATIEMRYPKHPHGIV